MTINNIVSGFCCTGVYPFDPSAILDKLPNISTEITTDESDPIIVNTVNKDLSESSSAGLHPLFSHEELNY